MLVKFIVTVYLIQFSPVKSEEGEYDCDSPIYCHGDLLHTIQLSKLFKNSSRQFVDMKLKNSPQDILKEFENLKKDDDDQLENFVNRNFEEDKADTCELVDFKETFDFADGFVFKDQNYREFYEKINGIWKKLAVKTPADVETNSDRHSMIYLPNCYIKTEESDSMPQPIQTYMVVRGLLSNGMIKTVEGIIRNYAYMIEKYKFSLYTNRVYASTRTQLPLLASMVIAYLHFNVRRYLLKEMLQPLKNEFDWWVENRMVEFTVDEKKFKMFRYQQSSRSPRPEEYKLDSELAQNLGTTAEKNKYFSEARCSNESGFNFSSRFLQNETNHGKRWNLDVSSIIPVELNSVLQVYAKLLASWCKELKDKEQGKKYSEMADQISDTINEVLWNKDRRMWFDFNWVSGKSIDTYYVTNLMPIFTESHGLEDEELEKIILSYLDENKIFVNESINDRNKPNIHVIPTSKYESGEESDYPYGSLIWNFFIIDGFRKIDSSSVRIIAVKLARMLIKTNYEVYKSRGILFETNNSVSRNSNENKKYDEVNETTAAALGCITTLLKLFGKFASHSDFSELFPNVSADIISEPAHEEIKTNLIN